MDYSQNEKEPFSFLQIRSLKSSDFRIILAPDTSKLLRIQK